MITCDIGYYKIVLYSLKSQFLPIFNKNNPCHFPGIRDVTKCQDIRKKI